MRKVLVTGFKGQLGSEIAAIANKFESLDFIFVDRDEMPLDDCDLITAFLDNVNPDIIINAGAYTAVDHAEKEKDLANQINHLAVAAIAKWAQKNDAKLLHLSTDYVFDGESSVPLKETDIPNPINWYGTTKLSSEEAILKHLPNGIIIRTSWVYSRFGNNFVKTMLRLMNEKESINVVNDQVGTPTNASDLANAILTIINSNEWVPGIYNYSNEGEISWYDFAKAIQKISGLNCKVHGVDSSQFPTLAKRPSYSLLDKSKIKATYLLKIPDWKDSLKQLLTNHLL
jgi:dTDP-4-dehydrorhamnose reductase